MLTEPHRGQGQVGCLPLCRKTANQTDRECEALHNQKNKENKSLFPSSNDQFGVGEEDSFQFLLAVHCDLPLPHPFHTHTHTHLPLLPFFLPPPFVFNEVPACVQRWSDLFAHGGAPGPHGARVPRGAHSQATWPARGCAGMRIVAEPLRSCTRTVQPGAKTTSSSVRGKALHLPPLQTVASKQRTTQTKKVHIDIHTHILATTIDCVRTHHR